MVSDSSFATSQEFCSLSRLLSRRLWSSTRLLWIASSTEPKSILNLINTLSRREITTRKPTRRRRRSQTDKRIAVRLLSPSFFHSYTYCTHASHSPSLLLLFFFLPSTTDGYVTIAKAIHCLVYKLHSFYKSLFWQAHRLTDVQSNHQIQDEKRWETPKKYTV